jgi:GT2 family glycosyltransferase
VVGAKLLYDNDTIQHAGVVIGLGGAAGHVLVGEDRDGPGYFNYVNMLNTYSALTGACFMVRTEVFDQVGGFDELFGTEYNDVDFCLKVREAGYTNLYVPHCELYHYESISRGHPHSTSESYKKHVKEVNLFRKKWKAYVEHDPCYNPNLSLGVHNFGLK